MTLPTNHKKIQIKNHKNPLSTENILSELSFVWKKYNLKTITKIFAKRYAQNIPKTTLQLQLENMKLLTAESLSKEDTLKHYDIDEHNLFLVYEALEKKARVSGIDIEYADISTFSEDEYYKNEHADDPEHVKHAETARSDGKILLLEKDIEKAGGITGRMYDLLHLAFGHMVQWSSNDTAMLLTREESWAIGYRNHDTSPDRVIDMMSFYELEAGMQGVEALRQILDGMTFSEDQKERITQYFANYVYCDSSYIIQHYRGNHESFQKFWKFGQPIPPRIPLPIVENFIQRHAVEIGLIRDKQK
jgi:hypothetical protein